jgi:hypothetical protein
MKNIRNKNLIAIFAVLALVLSFSSAKPILASQYTVGYGATNHPYTTTNDNSTNTNQSTATPNNTYNIYNTYNTSATNTHNEAVNPSPVLNLINPNSAIAGSEDIVVNIAGLNFIPKSMTKFENTFVPTTYIDSKHLVATFKKADLDKEGKYAITIFNPAPGGGTSNIIYFMVEKNSSSLGANALFAGFMPSLLEWLLLLLLLLLIIILIRKFLKKKKITLIVSNITSTSATLNATGLTANETYILEVTGPLGPNKVQVVAGKNGVVGTSFSNLTPGIHYTASIVKYDSHTKQITELEAPVLYFDTLKYA